MPTTRQGTRPRSVAPPLLAGCAVGPELQAPGHRAPRRPSAARRPPDGALGRRPRLVGPLSGSPADGARPRRARRTASTPGSRPPASSRPARSQPRSTASCFPAVGYAANADRGPQRTSWATPTPQGGGATANGFDGYLGAAWEFDLWGRVRRLDEAARAQYLATEEARRGVQLSLVSEVATAYFELLELDEELAIAHEADAVLRREPEALQPPAGGRRRLEARHRERGGRNGNQRGADPRDREADRSQGKPAERAHRPQSRARSPAGLASRTKASPPMSPSASPPSSSSAAPTCAQAEEAARAANAGIGVTIGGFLPRIGLSAILGAVSPQPGRNHLARSGPLVGRRPGDRPPLPGRWPPRPVRAGEGRVGAVASSSTSRRR